MDFDLLIVILVMAIGVALAIGLKFLIVLFTKKGINKLSKNDKKDEKGE